MVPVVYRIFDVKGSLLYIGSTNDFEARRSVHLASHQSPVAFPIQVCAHRWETTEYPDMASASAAERAAIRDEAPYLNRQHNPKRWRRVAGSWEPVADLYEMQRAPHPADVSA